MTRTDQAMAFLTGAGRDAAGRTIADVLAFDNAALEAHHDYIQWLFPLDEPSRAVPGSPVLGAEAIAAIRASEPAQERLRSATARMIEFYERSDHWRRPFDHNHLRITRIIKSLRLLAGDETADAFKATIAELSRDLPIDGRARQFWQDA